MESTDTPKKRGWFWAIAFSAFGLVYITDVLRDPGDPTVGLLAGVGMLLLVPHAFLYPQDFASRTPRPTNLTGWMVVFGVLLVAISLVIRLLEP